MFRKLVSNLPFQPALLSDVAFYAHRLKQEHAIRRLGFILILIGFGIQIFAVAFPPESSLATNAGDIIYGASSKKDVLTAYRKNEDQFGRKDIRAIFDHYGIGEAQIEKATSTTVKDSNKNYINTSRSTTQFADTFVPIEGAVDGGIYEFPLEYWRKNEFPNGYPAITGISTYGFRFWILLKGCGNIVYEKGAKKPNLEIQKIRTSPDNVIEGNTITYDIRFRNTGAVPSTNTKIVDDLPDNLRYISYKSTTDVTFKKAGKTLTWRMGNKDSSLAPSNRWHQITLTVRADSTTTKKQCNSVVIDAANAKKADSADDACVYIVKQTCPGTGLPIPAGGVALCQVDCPDGSKIPYNQACATPQLSCSSLDVTLGDTWQKRQFATTIVSQPGAVVKEVQFYVNNAKVATVTSPNSIGQYVAMHDFGAAGTYAVRSEIMASSGQVQPGQNCSLTEKITPPTDDSVILVTDKSVRNDTQNINDANNTTANPGDSLTYTLFITNKGGKVAENIALSGEYAEDISDILEYATVTSLQDGALNKDTGKITWPAVTIEPGKTIQKTFSVKIKDPLPATPISLSDPLSFDYEMHNKYGRTVVVKLDRPASKVVEQTASALPNTGPGSTLIITTLIVVVVAYFYYRNKLLAKELLIIQREFQTGGL
jgi:uncharacterized repeat protein (TIGR01451 family)